MSEIWGPISGGICAGAPAIGLLLLQEIQQLGGILLYAPARIPGMPSNEAILNAIYDGQEETVYDWNPVAPNQPFYNGAYQTDDSIIYPGGTILVPKMYNLLDNSVYPATQTTTANQPLIENEPASYGPIIETGSPTIGKIYEIIAQSVVDFTADGAPDSNVGTVFYATSGTVTLSAIDSVKEVLSWKKPHVAYDSAQYYSVAHTQELSDILTQGSFSVICRFTPNELNRYQGVIDKSLGGGTSDISVSFYIKNQNSTFQFTMSNGTTVSFVVAETNSLIIGVPTTIGFYFDAAIFKARLYQDGEWNGLDDVMVVPQANTLPLRIGEAFNNTNYRLNADINFICLFNSALTLSQFQNISAKLESATT